MRVISGLSHRTLSAFLPLVGFALMYGVMVVRACDDEAPSESVGACKTGPIFTCASFKDNIQCDFKAPDFGTLDVLQTFPTTCLTDKVGTNCNQNLQDCFAKCNCKWIDNSCHLGKDLEFFTQVNKREVKKCK